MNARRKITAGLILTAAAAVLLAVVSCGTTKVTRAVVILPDVPGAHYIGSKECEQCHDQICRDFVTADHARLITRGTNAPLSAGCESCHGPCSLHSDSGGETLPPFTFTAGRAKTDSYGARSPTPPPRATENVCYQCHQEVRGQFELPDHHPVTEGKFSCSECHSPHKGSALIAGGTALLSQNDECLKCHTEQRGPFVFQHEALHESCTQCHAPHGSVNAKLLTVRNANLCLQCHFQQSVGGKLFIGDSDHTTRITQGTCWTAGCHEAVHGSRVSPSLRF